MFEPGSRTGPDQDPTKVEKLRTGPRPKKIGKSRANSDQDREKFLKSRISENMKFSDRTRLKNKN